jgi:hypothetical protein
VAPGVGAGRGGGGGLACQLAVRRPAKALSTAHAQGVECYRRTEGDNWLVEMHDDLDAAVKLESVACEIPLRQMYSKVSWLS